MKNISEENIVDQIRQGNNDAYEFLYAHYFIALKSFCNSYVKNEGIADDTVQGIFISLLDLDFKFKTLPELKLYLYKSVKNRAIDSIRHMSVRLNYHDRTLAEMDTEQDFFHRMLEYDTYAALTRAIEMLPPKCSEVMRMSMEGYKMGEIAEKMSISVDTVNEHKINARRKLKVMMKDYDMLLLVTPLSLLIETL